jgi:putative endonuclease
MPKPESRRDIGQRGEVMARDYLVERGWTILETNYRTKQGEIDIVALQNNREREPCTTIAFVEVKTRNGSIEAKASVTAAKRRQLVRMAKVYTQRHPCELAILRFDVIAIELPARLEHYEGAFDALGRPV